MSIGNPFGKRIKGASLKKQAEWRNKSSSQKRTARRKFGDIDQDGVPNPWDCQPHNPMEQDFKPMWDRNKALEMTAAKRFGGQKNIEALERLGQGRDRVVYALDKDKVLKVAKNVGGLGQNEMESDLQYLEQVDHLEDGRDYVVMKRVDKAGPTTTKLLKPLKKFSQMDFDRKTSELQDAFYEAGIPDFMDYDIGYGDLIRKANWGEKDGKPVLIDGGTLSKDSFKTYRLRDADPETRREWELIKGQRKQFKQKGKGKKTRQKGGSAPDVLANFR